jgi:tetratricopeptide (TPR) repeat protein
MSDAAERQLIELVSREQRGTRRVLIAGISTLVLVVAMSAALAAYYAVMANRLSATSAQLMADSKRLDRHAFNMRREIDQQKNRVSSQEAAIRRAHDELRGTYQGAASKRSKADLLVAVTGYLQQGRHSLSDERLIESAGRSGDEALDTLAGGVASLLAWQRNGLPITKDTEGLPEQLEAARQAFTTVSVDPSYRVLAETGLAWILFIDASSERSAYAPQKCEAVIQRVAQISSEQALSLQPLYWRAQCNRKMGRTVEALRDYSMALNKIDPAGGDTSDSDELTLQMNAYHGLGTVLITTAGLQDDPNVIAARALARRMCTSGVDEGVADTMKMTRACLDKAILLRRRLGQTPNQQSGTAENISFTYLLEGDFSGALANAQKVERTGLFAWNELIRALAAEEVANGTTDDVEPTDAEAVRATAAEARRNVSMFAPNQFNPCELQALLTPEVYVKAEAILRQEHADFDADCA